MEDELIFVNSSLAVSTRASGRALLVLDARDLTGIEVRSFANAPHVSDSAILVVVDGSGEIEDFPYQCETLDFLSWPCPPHVITTRLSCFRSHFLSPDELKSTSMFHELADTVPLLIWQSRPDGIATYYNERWYAYTGMPPATTLPSDSLAVVHPDDRQEAEENWQRSLRTGETFCGEYRLREAASGLYKWHYHLAEPIRDAAGKIKKWIGSAVDIDERKRNVEESKRLYRELERKGEIKDDFLKTLSHELRTPLNIILGYGALLNETGSLPLDEAASLGRILEQARNILSMVEELPWRALNE